MESLGYQNPDDAREEIRQDWKRRTFGVSRKEIWETFAEEIGGRYEPARWRQSDRVVVAVGPWHLTLDVYLREKLIFTRLRAPFISTAGLRFRIYRETPWGTLRKAIGMRDIEVGDPTFDDDFIVRANQPEMVKQLLANASVRRHMAAQPHSMLEIRDSDGWRGVRFTPKLHGLWF
jgi:hypothetical protein